MATSGSKRSYATKLWRDKGWLHQRYVIERLSTCQIAKSYRDQYDEWVTPDYILRWLKKNDIPLRDRGEAQRNRYEKKEK